MQLSKLQIKRVKRGITHTVMGNIPYDEIMKIAEGIR